MTTIYILKCEMGKYYVGKTNNIERRKQEHLSGSCAWTKKYKPISIDKIVNNASSFDEDKYTKEYMNKYGIDNVRGGAYASINLTDNQINTLNTEIRAASNKCVRCGRSGHYIKDCYAKKDILGTIIYDYNSDSDSGSDSNFNCFRCGRSNHFANECYAKIDVYGNKLS